MLLNKRSVQKSPKRMLLMSVCCSTLLSLLISCSSNLPVQHDVQRSEPEFPPPAFSIVFVIHGDGDYLYHDTAGIEYKADEVALAGAITVAEQNPHAEVFIFHQRSRKNFMFFFPRHDGEFYYYRNGSLITNELYWREHGVTRFDPEVKLFRRLCANDRRESIGLFLYFGHEIPEFGGMGYDGSYPGRSFTVHDLAAGLNGFTQNSKRFDLMVLSTCFGGTPYTIGTLGSFAKTIVASPGNLHLSYFDLSPLERLEMGLLDGNVKLFAQKYARRSFDRLISGIQTEVSIAVYDTDLVQSYVHAVQSAYEEILTAKKEIKTVARATGGHCDCGDLSGFALPAMSEGVDILYRPARFGRSQHRRSHSGWECLLKGISPETASQNMAPIQP